MEVLGLTAESYLRKEWRWSRHEEKLQRSCWAFSYQVSCRHCTYIYSRRRTHLESRKQYRCAHLLNFIRSKGREVRGRRPQWDWAGGGEGLHALGERSRASVQCPHRHRRTRSSAICTVSSQAYQERMGGATGGTSRVSDEETHQSVVRRDVQEEDMNGGECGRDTEWTQFTDVSGIWMSEVLSPRLYETCPVYENDFWRHVFTSEISRLPALIYSPFVCVCARALGRNSNCTTT